MSCLRVEVIADAALCPADPEEVELLDVEVVEARRFGSGGGDVTPSGSPRLSPY
jgi:hypothetical protein